MLVRCLWWWRGARRTQRATHGFGRPCCGVDSSAQASAIFEDSCPDPLLLFSRFNILSPSTILPCDCSFHYLQAPRKLSVFFWSHSWLGVTPSYFLRHSPPWNPSYLGLHLTDKTPGGQRAAREEETDRRVEREEWGKQEGRGESGRGEGGKTLELGLPQLHVRILSPCCTCLYCHLLFAPHLRQQDLSNQLFQSCCHFGHWNVKIHDTGLSKMHVFSNFWEAGRALRWGSGVDFRAGLVSGLCKIASLGWRKPKQILGNGAKLSSLSFRGFRACPPS